MCSNHDFSLAAEGGQKILGYLGVDLLSRALETEGGVKQELHRRGGSLTINCTDSLRYLLSSRVGTKYRFTVDSRLVDLQNPPSYPGFGAVGAYEAFWVLKC